MTLPDLVGVVPDWVDDAACGPRNRPPVDPEGFFPHPGENNEHDTKDVREFCRYCPVNKACAAYALTNNIEFGIWGGLTERQRRKLKRNARAERAVRRAS